MLSKYSAYDFAGSRNIREVYKTSEFPILFPILVGGSLDCRGVIVVGGKQVDYVLVFSA